MDILYGYFLKKIRRKMVSIFYGSIVILNSKKRQDFSPFYIYFASIIFCRFSIKIFRNNYLIRNFTTLYFQKIEQNG